MTSASAAYKCEIGQEGVLKVLGWSAERSDGDFTRTKATLENVSGKALAKGVGRLFIEGGEASANNMAGMIVVQKSLSLGDQFSIVVEGTDLEYLMSDAVNLRLHACMQ